ncbi:hypothetical protein ACVBE9_10025 [Eionea flava]
MRDELIKYYENSRAHYTAYHNHKELSAWAGLVLFVFISGFINLIKLPDNHKIETAVILTFFVITISFLVYRYISNQLVMKDLGGAYAAAAVSFITDFVAQRIEDNELSKYLEVEELPETHAQSKLVLPIRYIKKAEILNTRARGFQDTTRTMIYGLLLSVTIIVLASKWLQAIG